MNYQTDSSLRCQANTAIRLRKESDLGKQIDVSPLMMVDDYLAYTTGGRSLLYGLERLPEQGNKISFYRFLAPLSSVTSLPE